MAERRDWCVTANVDRGRKPAAWDWLTRALAEQVAVVFAQELHHRDRLEELTGRHGYRVIWPERVERGWQVVSPLVVRADLEPEPLDDAVAPPAAVFDSYVCGAQVGLPGLGRVQLFSVHASPHPVDAERLKAYPEPIPAARQGGDGVPDAGRLFYSDLILDTLRRAAATGPVLAAGDLNEARAWDDRNLGHTWGTEFFAAVAEAGLVDVTHRLWGEERRTRFHPTHPPYQLDVVLASPTVAAAVAAAEIDSAWARDPDTLRALPDHAPVWFCVLGSH